MVKIMKIGLFVVGALAMMISIGEAQDFYRARQNMGSKPIYGNMQSTAWKQAALRKMGPWQARAYWTGRIADDDRDRRWIVNEKRNQRTGGNNTVAKPFLNEGAKIGTCRSTTR